MTQHYDICIIGGGIQGAGTALLAAQRGYSVLLVEQQSFGWATSSRSSKLIHGGLRYLQTAQFKLVRECLKERAWMLKSLPHLVKSNWFYIPIYKNSHYRSWEIFIGLSLYRVLAGFGEHSKFKRVPKKDWPQLANVKQDGLVAVFAYQDAQTNDLLLTQAVAHRSEQLGACLLENCQFVSATARAQDSADDLLIYDIALAGTNDELLHVSANVIVNASGPWINSVLSKISANDKIEPQRYDLVQGAHLVCSPQLSERCFYLEAPKDQRAIFMLPWTVNGEAKTLVGTTETLYQGDPATPAATESEVAYLQATIAHYFPEYDYKIEDSFAGLRVLPSSEKSAFKRSRETQLSNQQQVLSLYGGKLTSWRISAVKVLEEVEKILGKRGDSHIDELFNRPM